jgi:DMSO/TMAO reductase YedYZ molybdopterin-dependent catalytic subunit
VPHIERATWRLRVHGHVARPFELSFADLSALPQNEVTADFHCVTGWSVLDNRWTGVLLLEIARRAGIRADCTHVRLADRGYYDTNVPLAQILSPDALLATARNREPLPPEHGGPLRAILPALYAWKSCKWLCEIEFLTQDRLGYWEKRGYHNDADPWLEQRLV